MLLLECLRVKWLGLLLLLALNYYCFQLHENRIIANSELTQNRSTAVFQG